MFSNEVLQGSDFDPIAFLKHTLHLPNIDTATNQLTVCVTEVDDKIKAAVGTHFDQMLAEVDVCQKAAKDTSKIHSSVASLSSSCGRLSHTIEGSYSTIEASMYEVRNTGVALDTLKAVHRIVAAVEKLPTGQDDTDISRCARRLRDVDDLLTQHHDQVSGIHVIDAALSTITAVSSSCRQRAHDMVRQGLLSGKHSDVIVALQSLSMLSSLGRFVVTYVSEAKRETLKSVVKLDAQSIATSMAEQTDVTKAKEVLFAKLDISLREIGSRCQLLSTLHTLLERQQETAHQHQSLDIASGNRNAANHEADTSSIHGALIDFSNSLVSQLLEKFARLGKKPNVNGVLITEYPRLYKCLAMFGSQAGAMIDLGTTVNTHSFMEKVLLEYEKQYAGNVTERHLDRIHKLISNMNEIMPKVGDEHNPINQQSVAGNSRGGYSTSVGSSLGTSELSSPVTGMPTGPHSHLAQRLDCRPLIKVLSGDISSYRQEAHLAYIHLRVATSTLRSVYDKLNEGVSRVSGSYAPELTIGQLFHLNLANCAAFLHNELMTVVGTAISIVPASTPSSAAGGGGNASSLGAYNYRVPTSAQLSNTMMLLRRSVEAFSTFQRKVVTTELVDGGIIHVWAVSKRLLVSAVDANLALPRHNSSTALLLSASSKRAAADTAATTAASLPTLVADAGHDLSDAIKGLVARLSLLHRVGSISDDARRQIVSLVLWKGLLWGMLQPDIHTNRGLVYALSRLCDDLGILLPLDRFPPSLRKTYEQFTNLLQEYDALGSENASVSTRSYIHQSLLAASTNSILRMSNADLRAAAPGASSALKIIYLCAALHHVMCLSTHGGDAAEGDEEGPAVALDTTSALPSSLPLHVAMSMSLDQVVEVVASWVSTGRNVKDKFKTKLNVGASAVIQHIGQTRTINDELFMDVKVMLGGCIMDIDATVSSGAGGATTAASGGEGSLDGATSTANGTANSP